MSAIAFNAMLIEFMTDLSDSFPENKQIVDLKKTVVALIQLSEGTTVPMTSFMEAISPYDSYIQSKDDALFSEFKLSFSDDIGIDMASLWKSLETEDKEAIWSYVQQLYFLGNFESSIPQSMMSMIETIANETIDKVQRGEMTSSEAQNPMMIMQELLKNKHLMDSIAAMEK